jgi:integrase
MSAQASTLDRSRYNKTRHRGLSYRLLAGGSRRHYGYVPGRGRVPLPGAGEREALAAYGELRGKAARGEKIAPANVRFRDVAEAWFVSKRRLRSWTRKAYRDALDRILLPRFAHRKLTEIDTDDIAHLIRELESKGLSPSTIQNYLKPLNGVLTFAVRRGLLSSNPYRNLTTDDRPEKPEPRPVYEWSSDEIGALLAAAETLAGKRESQYDYAPLLRTAIVAGLRLGELLGLKWADIDLDHGYLHVRRQLSRMGELAPPKTSSAVRQIALDPGFVKFLTGHKLRSTFSQPDDFVFASKTRGPLSHRNVQRRAFEPARDLAQIPKHVTFHDLRHAAASRLIDAGLSPVTVASVLGHRDSTVTLKVYAHRFDRQKRDEDVRAALAL